MPDLNSWHAVVTRVPEPSPHVSLHIVENSGLLFDRRQQLLFSANASAAYIWCCLEESISPTEIVNKLERRFSFGNEQAKRYLTGIIERWREDGLVDVPPCLRVPMPRRAARDAPRWFVPARPTGARAIRPGGAVTGTYDLLDTRFTLDFADEALFDVAHPLLAHLSSRDAPQDRIQLALAREGDEIVLFVNGAAYTSCGALYEVPPMTVGALAYLAVHRSAATYAVHAAAVRWGDRCILLPGDAGTGKSTLVAVLAAEGFEVLADDTVVFEHGTCAMRPVPLGVCVKPGSWPSLWRYYPELRTQPIYRRADGKTVKYIVTNTAGRRPVGRESCRVDVVVYPQYQASARPSLTTLDRPAALSRLLHCFYLLQGMLDEDAVEGLIEWISAPPCYELRYGSASEIVETLRDVCR